MPERVLALTYSFPPTAVPEAILSVKRLGNLLFDVEVITIAPFKPWMGDDHSLDDYIERRFSSVHRVTSPPLRGLLPLGRLGPITRCPDQFRLFNDLLYKKARQKLASFDYLVTWSQWHSVHLVGRRLARLPGAPPWVVHMSDPWSNNAYADFGPVMTRLNARLERRVLADANLLSFPAVETAERIIAVHPIAGKKTAIIPHAFDPGLYPPRATRSDGVLRFRYLGGFYGPRTPEPLFRALKGLNTSTPEIGRDLVVEIIGNVAPSMLHMLEELPMGQVVIQPPVDYRASLALMTSADVLLVVDAPADASPFLPSKLIDYLGARRPILTISPPGPAQRLTQEYGGWVADPRDIPGITDALRAAAETCRASETDGAFGDAGVRARYEAERVGREMASALSALRS